ARRALKGYVAAAGGDIGICRGRAAGTGPGRVDTNETGRAGRQITNKHVTGTINVGDAANEVAGIALEGNVGAVRADSGVVGLSVARARAGAVDTDQGRRAGRD